MNKYKVVNTRSYYECGDGCCTDWTDMTNIVYGDESVWDGHDVDAEVIVSIMRVVTEEEVDLEVIDTVSEDMKRYME